MVLSRLVAGAASAAALAFLASPAFAALTVYSDVSAWHAASADTSFPSLLITAPDTDGFNHLNVSEADVGQAAVPEPSTWAMMLLGFGGLGAMLRSRRRDSFTLLG